LLQKFVHKQAKTRKLDLAKSYRSQDKKAIKQICDDTRQQFKLLCDYQKDWPIHNILKLHLKYTSEAARRAKSASTAKKLTKVSKIHRYRGRPLLTRSQDANAFSVHEKLSSYGFAI